MIHGRPEHHINILSVKIAITVLLTHLMITDGEVEVFFQTNHRLDKELTGNKRNENLDKHPKLKEFLDHYMKQHFYFYSVKKWGDLNCKTCLPACLPLQAFQKIHLPPDPMPDEWMKAITKVFQLYLWQLILIYQYILVIVFYAFSDIYLMFEEFWIETDRK